MTDETTARDRAIEVAYTGGNTYMEAANAVDALLANPEVLRALAGAPTADVAALLAIAETARRMYAATDAGDRQDAANASRTLRDLLAAAPAVEPEGMDVAERPALYTKLCPAHGVTACPWCHDVPDLHDAIDRAGEFITAWGERADEQDVVAEAVYDDGKGGWPGTLYGADLRAILNSLVEPEGMDVEAQGEMADELTAAQAAIQRERERHTPETADVEDVNGISEATYCAYDGHSWPCPARRALDGDTTEES